MARPRAPKRGGARPGAGRKPTGAAHLQTWVPADVHYEVISRAERAGRTVSETLADLVRAGLDATRPPG